MFHELGLGYRERYKDVFWYLLGGGYFLTTYRVYTMKMLDEPWFGLRGSWLTFWVTVACATDMTLFGYDQGVFGIHISLSISLLSVWTLANKQAAWL